MKPPRIEHSNLISDALYYTSPRTGCSNEMGHGVVVGVVSTLMAMGHTFSTAINIVVLLLPDDARRESIPEAWRDVLLAPGED